MDDDTPGPVESLMTLALSLSDVCSLLSTRELVTGTSADEGRLSNGDRDLAAVLFPEARLTLR